MRDIEERIREYRPAGPPAELRAHVIDGAATAARRRARVWLAWLPAAAAATLIVVFQYLGARAQRDIDARTDDPAREELVPTMTTAFGGGDVAKQTAEWSLRTGELDVERTAAPAAIAGGARE